jgi:hypothetical protein
MKSLTLPAQITGNSGKYIIIVDSEQARVKCNHLHKLKTITADYNHLYCCTDSVWTYSMD